MMKNYHNRCVRELCHGVKERDRVAISEMAEHFLSLGVITSDSIIIPAPQHEGYAVYTKEMADIIALSTGCMVADVLESRPRRTLYEQKIAGREKMLQFYLKEHVHGDELFFLDNVLDTGLTFKTAKALVHGIKPLIYAHT